MTSWWGARMQRIQYCFIKQDITSLTRKAFAVLYICQLTILLTPGIRAAHKYIFSEGGPQHWQSQTTLTVYWPAVCFSWTLKQHSLRILRKQPKRLVAWVNPRAYSKMPLPTIFRFLAIQLLNSPYYILETRLTTQDVAMCQNAIDRFFIPSYRHSLRINFRILGLHKPCTEK